jgi:hypothetical protein
MLRMRPTLAQAAVACRQHKNFPAFARRGYKQQRSVALSLRPRRDFSLYRVAFTGPTALSYSVSARGTPFQTH